MDEQTSVSGAKRASTGWVITKQDHPQFYTVTTLCRLLARYGGTDRWSTVVVVLVLSLLEKLLTWPPF